MQKFLFVGERPSHLAVKIGATWENGKLAGKQLRDALLALEIAPATQKYLNLYKSPSPSEQDTADEKAALWQIWRLQSDGYTVVGIGQIVSERLKAYEVAHLAIVHPAARGAIRRKDRYQAHVRSILVEVI